MNQYTQHYIKSLNKLAEKTDGNGFKTHLKELGDSISNVGRTAKQIGETGKDVVKTIAPEFAAQAHKAMEAGRQQWNSGSGNPDPGSLTERMGGTYNDYSRFGPRSTELPKQYPPSQYPPENPHPYDGSDTIGPDMTESAGRHLTRQAFEQQNPGWKPGPEAGLSIADRIRQLYKDHKPLAIGAGAALGVGAGALAYNHFHKKKKEEVKEASFVEAYYNGRKGTKSYADTYLSAFQKAAADPKFNLGDTSFGGTTDVGGGLSINSPQPNPTAYLGTTSIGGPRSDQPTMEVGRYDRGGGVNSVDRIVGLGNGITMGHPGGDPSLESPFKQNIKVHSAASPSVATAKPTSAPTVIPESSGSTNHEPGEAAILASQERSNAGSAFDAPGLSLQGTGWNPVSGSAEKPTPTVARVSPQSARDDIPGYRGAAPAAPGNSSDLLARFLAAHGSRFDRNSAMDRWKLQQLQQGNSLVGNRDYRKARPGLLANR